MPRSLHVRLDDASAAALEVVRAGEMTDSEAGRTALHEAAARRRGRSARRGARGREQGGPRYAVVVQADEFLDLSTTLVAPTSASALPASFRPTIALEGRDTRVLVEQTTVVDPQRLGASAGRLAASAMLAAAVSSCLVLTL